MSDLLTKVNRRINLALYGEDVMFCYTLYRGRKEGKLKYLIIGAIVDWLFKLIRKETYHCRRCYVWEVRYGNKRRCKNG